MKKIVFYLLFLGVLFSFSSCTKDIVRTTSPVPRTSSLLSATKSDVSETRFFISKEMAWQIVFQETKSKSVSIKAFPSDSDPLVYAANLDEGWRIIPSDSRFGLYLAQSDGGEIDLEKGLNKGVRDWLQDYLDQITEARLKEEVPENSRQSVAFWERIRERVEKPGEIETGKTKSLEPDEDLIWAKVELSYTDSTFTTSNLNHLLETKWGQGYPWNSKFYVSYINNYVPTGCVSVALSQVLYYFHNQTGVPSGLYHTLSTNPYLYYLNNYCYYRFNVNRNDFTSSSSRWAQMPLNGNGGQTEQSDFVSDLMMDVGNRMGLFYSQNGGFVELNNSHLDIDTLFINNWATFSDTYHNTVKSNLDNGKPVIVTAFPENSSIAHTWVIDGYQFNTRIQGGEYKFIPCMEVDVEHDNVVRYYDYSYLLWLYPGLYSGMTVIEGQTSYPSYYRMNWGHDGNGDDSLYSMQFPSWQGYDGFRTINYDLIPKELLL